MSEERATIAQIQQAYGERSAHILNQMHDRYEEIAKAKPETQGSFFDRPDDAQKAAVIRDHRLELANKARAEAKEKYAESAREYRAKVEARKAEAEAALYGHGDPISADVIASAALASEEELLRLARVASKTGNASLKRAALTVAEDRNMGEVLVEVFDEEDKALYAEIKSAPPQEVLDRKTHDVGIDSVVPGVNADQLSPPAKGST